MEIEFRCRWYQRDFHKYLVNGGKRAIEIAHRRWDKDEVILAATRELAFKRVASYWHCLPEYEQGRKAIWTAVNPRTGKRRIDEAFPPEIRESKDEQQMFLRLKNGSTWQVTGSDRYNSLVGSGVAGVAFSEWALANPAAWAYIRPMLEENQGWAAFITTPRGRNHAHAMLEHARAHPDRWFAEVSTINDTKALTPTQQDEARQEYIAIYGDEVGAAQFDQEYHCSFDAAILGAIYGAEIRKLERVGRLTSLEIDPALPVHTVWDIGFTDDTAILLYQVGMGEVRIVDAFSSHGHAVEHYCAELKERAAKHGFEYGHHWLPHDAQAKHLAAKGRTVVEQVMAELGRNVKVLQNRQSEQQGILAARVLFPRLWVDAERCEDFMDALRNFRREWDDERKCFRDVPVHDWTNHYADTLRYLSWVWSEPPPAPSASKPFALQVPTFDQVLKMQRRNTRDD